MIVQIRDSAALSSIPVASLRSYLGFHRWDDTGKWGERPIDVFAKEHGGRTWEILVPHQSSIGGYASNMADALNVLAATEDRSQLDVFQDLMNMGADVIQVRSLNGLTDKPLSLRGSAELYQGAYKMVASAARAADSPRAAYRGGPNSKVAEYLDSVRPMPGYAPGYSLVLHSPVFSEACSSESPCEDEPLPFARQATVMLTQALDHANKAVSEAVEKDSLEHFARAVEFGVSANLCDSVAELARKGDGIEIGLDWAAIGSSNIEAARFQFSENSVQVLANAGKFFRNVLPSCDETVTGHVVRLVREPNEFDGRADLVALRDGRKNKVTVRFPESDYNQVIQAFQGRMEVSLIGDMHKTSGGFELRNPRDLTVSANSR